MSDVVARLATALAERYRIERELGAGGMATVYLAHDISRHEIGRPSGGESSPLMRPSSEQS